ncbi:hypothetical protein D9M71_453560 [compost metagenome]
MLAQGHVKGANTSTDRGGQRTFDGDDVILDRIQGFLGQPGILVIHLGGLLTGVDFHPGNLALAPIGFLYSSIDHFDHDGTDVYANAVAFDERDDRIIRNIERMVCIDGDFVADCRNLDFLVSHAALRFFWCGTSSGCPRAYPSCTVTGTMAVHAPNWGHSAYIFGLKKPLLHVGLDDYDQGFDILRR